MRLPGGKNGTAVKFFFSHGSRHSRGVCILIDPGVKVDKMECHFNDASGRIVLITLILNDLNLSLCNIYAPNNHADQLEFIRQLNSLLIDKSDLTALIIGGDWNCALSKKTKEGDFNGNRPCIETHGNVRFSGHSAC